MNYRAVVAIGLVVLAGVVSVVAVGEVAGAEHCSFPAEMEDTTGTGFGLSTVIEIARGHGWEVTLTESSGGGARFDLIDIELADE